MDEMRTFYEMSQHEENHAAMCTPEILSKAAASPLGLGVLYNLSTSQNVYTPEVVQMALDVINTERVRPEIRFVAFTLLHRMCTYEPHAMFKTRGVVDVAIRATAWADTETQAHEMLFALACPAMKRNTRVLRIARPELRARLEFI